MDVLKQYRIPFTGLKSGIHHFNFEVNEDFFKQFEGATIGKSDIHVDVKFEKGDNLFVLDFSIGGLVEVECDRCAELFNQELLDEHRVYVKFDDAAKQSGTTEDDIIYISRNDIYVDVSQLIYEFINLSLPYQKVCPDKADGTAGCNENVLKILEGKTKESDNQDKEPDPRWAALKKLK